jgi:hypothetical protein
LKVRLKTLKGQAESFPRLKAAILEKISWLNVCLKTEKKYFGTPK